MSIVKKIFIKNDKIISSISIMAGLISIIYVFTQYLELNTKYLLLITGVLASLLGAIISVLFGYIIKKKAKAKVFISYSSRDKEFAIKLMNDLNKNYIQSFTDENSIEIGDNIQEALEKKIQQTNIVIVIITENYNKSEWVKKELEFAKKNKKTILPVLADKTSLPEEIENIKYADFTEDYQNTLQQLVKSIKLKYQH